MMFRQMDLESQSYNEAMSELLQYVLVLKKNSIVWLFDELHNTAQLFATCRKKDEDGELSVELKHEFNRM